MDEKSNLNFNNRIMNYEGYRGKKMNERNKCSLFLNKIFYSFSANVGKVGRLKTVTVKSSC